MERGFLNSKEKGLAHEKMIREVLKALQEPKEIAIVHIRAHQCGDSLAIKGNTLADKAAKEVAVGEEMIVVAWMGELDEMEVGTWQLSQKEQQVILFERENKMKKANG